MKRALPLAVCLLMTVTFLVTGFSVAGNIPAVSESGTKNTGWVRMDSSIVVYWLDVNNILHVKKYNSGLVVTGQFEKQFKNFAPSELSLQYASEHRIEFDVKGRNHSGDVFIFLDKKLQLVYASTVIGSGGKKAAKDNHKRWDYFRDDLREWEVFQNDTFDSKTNRITITALEQRQFDLANTYPKTVREFRLDLDSISIEAAKIMKVVNNKVYVYVNESTEDGKQFIYCVDAGTGKLIYKTRLSIKYNDASSVKSKPVYRDATSCICSKCYWDEKLNRLLVSGTWLTDAVSYSGLFLMEMDTLGNITGSAAVYGVWLDNSVDYDARTGMFAYQVCDKAYQRVVEMKPLANGKFLVLSELYGKKLSAKSGSAQAIYFVDDFYHYFCMEAQVFTIDVNSVKPIQPNEWTPTVWQGNQHLDSITGFIPLKTHLVDHQFNDDVNDLCDASKAQHYRAFAEIENNRFYKVLTTDSVQVGNGTVTRSWFWKTLSNVVSKNATALIAPTPVHNQNFSLRSDFSPIDSRKMFRFDLTGDGFALSIVPW